VCEGESVSVADGECEPETLPVGEIEPVAETE
jgi:hypothetical protein